MAAKIFKTSTNREENVMKKLTVPGFALLFLLLSSTAWAGGETGLYLGGSLGSAGLDVSDGDVEYDDDDLAYKIFLGYNFGIVPLVNLAVEGSYVDFGTGEERLLGGNAETSVTGWDAFGLVGLNLGPVSLFGKAGAIYWDRESSVLAQSADDSGTDPAYGLGLQFQLLSFAIRAEYELFTLEGVDIGFASAGVSYTF
ncbi:MAG: porin family protein [Candidatus Manganitrophus sp. SB1]|nr:porin family protein [Candidatus Manganitrophus morganii]